MKRLRAASEEDIASVPGVPGEVARAVFESLRALSTETATEGDSTEGASGIK